jgi:hypothetical protein
MTVEMLHVEMLHTDGCPPAAEYLPRLRRLLVDAGFDAPIRTQLLVNDDQAQQERFLGSPTIRINGRDVDPASADRHDYGLTCRLYANPEGLRGARPTSGSSRPSPPLLHTRQASRRIIPESH